MLTDGGGRVTHFFLRVAKETISICLNVLAQPFDHRRPLKMSPFSIFNTWTRSAPSFLAPLAEQE